jgi:hypothetical protein
MLKQCKIQWGFIYNIFFCFTIHKSKPLKNKKGIYIIVANGNKIWNIDNKIGESLRKYKIYHNNAENVENNRKEMRSHIHRTHYHTFRKGKEK